MDWSPPDSSSMGFHRQEYWSGLLFPSPGALPYPEATSPALAGRFFTTEPPGNPLNAIRICLIQPESLFLTFSPLPLCLLPFKPTSKADLTLQQRPKSAQPRALGPEIALKDWILELWGLGFHRGAEKVLITRNSSCPWFDFDGRNLLFVSNFHLSYLNFPCFSFFPGCSRLIHWLILPLSLYSHPFLWFSISFHERGRTYLSLTLCLPCDLF